MSKVKRMIAEKQASAASAPAATPAPPAPPAGNSWTFNPAQLASYEQARQLRDYLNRNFIGRGIPPGDDENGATLVTNPNFPWLPPVPLVTGIFLPTWEAGPGGFQMPHAIGPNGEKLLFLSFRFNNGFVNNVGLCLDKFRRYPGQNAYCLNALSDEIGR